MNPHTLAESKKHRGFAFVTYASAGDAQDAIDNMDMNEMAGKVLKVYTARPMKQPAQLGGNRAGMFSCALLRARTSVSQAGLNCSLGIRRLVATTYEAAGIPGYVLMPTLSSVYSPFTCSSWQET